jgi:hypothetical protein
MLPTHCGKWLHAACALWIPEAVVSTDDDTHVPKAEIDDIPKVELNMWKYCNDDFCNDSFLKQCRKTLHILGAKCA